MKLSDVMVKVKAFLALGCLYRRLEVEKKQEIAINSVWKPKSEYKAKQNFSKEPEHTLSNVNHSASAICAPHHESDIHNDQRTATTRTEAGRIMLIVPLQFYLLLLN